MTRPDITVTKTAGGLGRRQPSQDMISGLVMNGKAVSGGAQLDTPYKLRSTKQAEDLGLTADYDDSESLLVHYHIKEFFRMNPSGVLWLMLVAQTASSNPLTIDKIVDKSNDYAKKLLVEANGEIRQLGVAMNPGSGYSASATNGIDTTVENAIPKAQALVDEELTKHRPVEVILEGRKLGDAPTALDLRSQSAQNVSVIVAQDLDKGNEKSRYNDHAALGTALGTISDAKVSENIGWVQKFNIQDKATGDFLKPGTSGNIAMSTLTDTNLDTLYQKGYIYAQSHTGLSGIYWIDSHTCTKVSSDFAYIENNRTIHKAIRLVRGALLPRLKGPVDVDPSSGTLSPEVVKSFQADAGDALGIMDQRDELSGHSEFVDPEQDVLATSKVLVGVTLIPVGVAREIEIEIGFDNPA